MNGLNPSPAWRAGLYWAAWMLGGDRGRGRCRRGWVGAPPLWLTITISCVLLVQSQLHALAGVNTPLGGLTTPRAGVIAVGAVAGAVLGVGLAAAILVALSDLLESRAVSDFVELGNGPAPMRVTLVDGRDNALGLQRRDDTGPVAWPSAPTLRLRDVAGAVVFDAAGVLSNADTVASWTVPDAVVSLGTARPVRGSDRPRRRSGVRGTVVVLDGWSGVCPSVDVGAPGVVVGPRARWACWCDRS